MKTAGEIEGNIVMDPTGWGQEALVALVAYFEAATIATQAQSPTQAHWETFDAAGRRCVELIGAPEMPPVILGRQPGDQSEVERMQRAFESGERQAQLEKEPPARLSVVSRAVDDLASRDNVPDNPMGA